MSAWLQLQTGFYLELQTGTGVLLLQGGIAAGVDGGGAPPLKRRKQIEQDDEEITRLIQSAMEIMEV